MLVPRELGYPMTFRTKIRFLKSISENCTHSLLFCSYLLHYIDQQTMPIHPQHYLFGCLISSIDILDYCKTSVVSIFLKNLRSQERLHSWSVCWLCPVKIDFWKRYNLDAPGCFCKAFQQKNLTNSGRLLWLELSACMKRATIILRFGFP